MNACGAADIIAKMYGDDDDDEEITTQPVYMGGPFVSDDDLFRRLDDRLLTWPSPGMGGIEFLSICTVVL